MAVFLYKAKNTNGQTIKGKLEGSDTEAIKVMLRENSLYPLEIKREYNTFLNIDLADMKKIPLKDIAIFCKQFSYILTSGISILRALEIVGMQTENKKLKRILGEANESVQRGRALSESLEQYADIPRILINMIQVGEASGTLEKMMITMSEYFDKQYKQQQKIKSAMTYPVVVSVFAIIVVLLLVTKVLPTFIKNIASAGGGELPLSTRVILAFSNIILTKWWLLILIGIALWMLYKVTNQNGANSKFIDKMKLKAPIIGKIYVKVIAARFASTFSILMASGISVLESLEICHNVIENIIVKEILSNSKDSIKKGQELSLTLEQDNIFPPMLTQMIKIGEESGTLDAVLQKTSEFYEGEVDVAIAQLTTLLEPTIMMVLAFLVGIIIMAIIQPMFQMYNSIG